MWWCWVFLTAQPCDVGKCWCCYKCCQMTLFLAKIVLRGRPNGSLVRGGMEHGLVFFTQSSSSSWTQGNDRKHTPPCAMVHLLLGRRCCVMGVSLGLMYVRETAQCQLSRAMDGNSWLQWDTFWICSNATKICFGTLCIPGKQGMILGALCPCLPGLQGELPAALSGDKRPVPNMCLA